MAQKICIMNFNILTFHVKELGFYRKFYYRELVARFGHHVSMFDLFEMRGSKTNILLFDVIMQARLKLESRRR